VKLLDVIGLLSFVTNLVCYYNDIEMTENVIRVCLPSCFRQKFFDREIFSVEAV